MPLLRSSHCKFNALDRSGVAKIMTQSSFMLCDLSFWEDHIPRIVCFGIVFLFIEKMIHLLLSLGFDPYKLSKFIY